MPPGTRKPARESDFCELWEISYRDLAMFEAEDGFVEAVASYKGYWLIQRHAVYAAVLERACDMKNPEQMKWVDKYLGMTEPRKNVTPHPVTKGLPPAEPLPDDNDAVDLSES